MKMTSIPNNYFTDTLELKLNLDEFFEWVQD